MTNDDNIPDAESSQVADESPDKKLVATGNDGGFLMLARLDLRKINDITGARRYPVTSLWLQLLAFSNFKHSLKFKVCQDQLGKFNGMSRKTVGLCLAELADIRLLKYRAPRMKNGRQDTTEIVLSPAIRPFGDKTKDAPCNLNTHGDRVTMMHTHESYSNKDTPSIDVENTSNKNGGNLRKRRATTEVSPPSAIVPEVNDDISSYFEGCDE